MGPIQDLYARTARTDQLFSCPQILYFPEGVANINWPFQCHAIVESVHVYADFNGWCSKLQEDLAEQKRHLQEHSWRSWNHYKSSHEGMVSVYMHHFHTLDVPVSFLELLRNMDVSQRVWGSRGACSWLVSRHQNATRTIVHEIGHALGLWHEQSRPDRDRYVRVLTENIKDGAATNFAKCTFREVNSQRQLDTVYPKDAFSKNSGDTIQVTNKQLYQMQNSPTLGQDLHLSYKDYTTVSRLYRCPRWG